MLKFKKKRVLQTKLLCCLRSSEKVAILPRLACFGTHSSSLAGHSGLSTDSCHLSWSRSALLPCTHSCPCFHSPLFSDCSPGKAPRRERVLRSKPRTKSGSEPKQRVFTLLPSAKGSPGRTRTSFLRGPSAAAGQFCSFQDASEPEKCGHISPFFQRAKI